MARYLVTGGAGFIGGHLARCLCRDGHEVRILDDFSTGKRGNLEGFEDSVEIFEASILDRDAVRSAMQGVEVCLHQAALPSVPRSVADPWSSNRVNVEGTLNVFLAARDAGVRRVVYASSSSVYGDADSYPAHEQMPRRPLSPYAVSKATTELYAESFVRLYGQDIVGLRYFNVFGPRQDPDSPYAAVIPRFIRAMRRGERPVIFGDGHQARDFTAVGNVVSANLKAAEAPGAIAGVYNIACGKPVTLLQLVEALNAALGSNIAPELASPRDGDIKLSWAAIERARQVFGYEPIVSFEEGLKETVASLQ